jgi:hypothetical protein
MSEFWKTIEGFTTYEISSLGRVRHGNKMLKVSRGTDGYLRVSLKNMFGDWKQRNVHILVAKAFIPNPLQLPTVNHINTKKVHCCVNNLEWRSRAGQMHHARLTTFKNAGVYFISDGRKKPWVAVYNLNGKHKHVGVFATYGEARIARTKAVSKLPYVA